MTRGARSDGVEKFRVSSAGLALLAPMEEAAACDEEPGHHDGEDGRESSAEGCPMDIDKGKAIVGLIQCDVVGLVVDHVCD